METSSLPAKGCIHDYEEDSSMISYIYTRGQELCSVTFTSYVTPEIQSPDLLHARLTFYTNYRGQRWGLKTKFY